MVSRLSTYVMRPTSSFVFIDIPRIIYRNFKQIVLAAYEWLSENYQDGDLIYIFGAIYALD
jgi:hypothetical protein